MDVLFGSIDVRDLLPSAAAAGEDDPTAPLSAPDLRLLIDRLSVRSLRIKDDVRRYLLSRRPDFSAAVSAAASASSSSENACASLSSALELLDARPIDAEIRDLAAEIGAKGRELAERREAARAVDAVAEVFRTVQSARRDLREGRIVDASEAMRDLKAALRVSGTEAEEEPKVYGLLREEWGDCFDELQEVLARHMESAVRFEAESGRLRVSSEADGVELRRVLEAMEIAGVMDYGFAKVADLMIKHVMNPAVRCASGIVFTEDCNQDSGLNADAILSIIMTSSLDIQGEQLSAVDIYSKLTQVIKFIYKYICFCNNQWMQCFGRLTWPRISELVITSFLSKAIPDDTSKIAEFQNIINYTVEFENVLKEMMFISMGTVDERLSSFAHDVEVHFASRRRNEILTKARNLLLQCDFVLYVENTTKIPFQTKHKPEKNPENSVDLLFETGGCLVSQAASQLMELVHQTLENVCLSSTKVATEFYHAARDALILYEAIVPIKLEKQLDSISQVAIVVHNDCHYMYQEILGLAFEYRINFPSGVKECAVFADLAMHFHRLSENILGKQVQLISFSLNEAISSANGFQNTHQMQQYESAKFSIDQVVFILEKVHIIWQPLLPTLIYRRTMCIVLEFILSRMTKEILLIDDMAAEETLQLQKLIHLTLENLCSLFESLVSDVNVKNNVLEKSMWIELEEMVPSLRKLRKLADLLDMPLKSITSAWESRELVTCGFTYSEVKNFIKAIFTDSPLRRECLLRIESANA